MVHGAWYAIEGMVGRAELANPNQQPVVLSRSHGAFTYGRVSILVVRPIGLM